MLSKTRDMPAYSPVPGVIPDTITGPTGNDIAPAQRSAAMNRVKVNWVFGTSHVSLVWLVPFAAILGWLLGLVATAAFHWRTRAVQRQHGVPS